MVVDNFVVDRFVIVREELNKCRYLETSDARTWLERLTLLRPVKFFFDVMESRC